MKRKLLVRIVLSGMFIALAIVLPFVTMGIPTVGKMISPMHIPVLLCGAICGPYFGMLVGFVSPLLRLLLVGMPQINDAVVMAIELTVYGLMMGLLFRPLYSKSKKYALSVYVSLVISLLVGKVFWGISRVFLAMLLGLDGFTLKLFFAKGFIEVWPSFVINLTLVPSILYVIINYTNNEQHNKNTTSN